MCRAGYFSVPPELHFRLMMRKLFVGTSGSLLQMLFHRLRVRFQAAPVKYRSTVLSVMETMFGIGLMIGPFLGSVLYEVGGFNLPFVICGAALAGCPLVAIFCIGSDASMNEVGPLLPLTNMMFYVV